MAQSSGKGGNMLTLDEIKKRLQDRNLQKVARAIGCTRAVLSGYMCDRYKPSPEMMAKLSEYLEVNK